MGNLWRAYVNGWKVQVDCSCSVLVWVREFMNFSSLTTLYFRAVVNLRVYLYRKLKSKFVVLRICWFFITRSCGSRKQQICHWELPVKYLIFEMLWHIPSILLVVRMLRWLRYIGPYSFKWSRFTLTCWRNRPVSIWEGWEIKSAFSCN